MTTKIQLRHDTNSNWINVNPILDIGEIGIEIDTNKLKIGNGVDTYSNLPYLNDSSSIISYLGLSNKPQINSIELIGNKSLDDLNIAEKSTTLNGYGIDDAYTKIEIDNKLNNINTKIDDIENLQKIFNTTLELTSFINDETYSQYSYKADISIENVTANSIVNVYFNNDDAISGNFSPIVESFDGYIRIYCKEKPLSSISIPTITYYI